MENKDNISDELLAAYLEGNTSEEETRRILQALKTDESLQETLDIALRVDEGEEALFTLHPSQAKRIKGDHSPGTT